MEIKWGCQLGCWERQGGGMLFFVPRGVGLEDFPGRTIRISVSQAVALEWSALVPVGHKAVL